MVEYVYPCLPLRCVTCSKWGHIKEDYIANKSTKKDEVTREKETRSLKVIKGRNVADLVAVSSDLVETERVNKENVTMEQNSNQLELIPNQLTVIKERWDVEEDEEEELVKRNFFSNQVDRGSGLETSVSKKDRQPNREGGEK